MADVYSSIFYHFIWTTKNREPLLSAEIEALVFAKIRRKCEELGVRVFALNGVCDHVHLVCDLPTRHSAALLMKHLKGSSAHLVNHLGDDFSLYWQRGYGAVTFSESALANVVAYVERQKIHHERGDLKARLEYVPEYQNENP